MADELPDISEQHQFAVDLGYERGERLQGGRTFKYGRNKLFELSYIKLASPDDEAEGNAAVEPLKQCVEPLKHHYEAGHYALVNVRSKVEGLKGEVYANSVARILGIFEDTHGHCFVALHYFWRWGQIHAHYDLHPATRPASPHQIFLQKAILRDKAEINGQLVRTAVRYGDDEVGGGSGKFVELLPACELIKPAVVRHKSEYKEEGELDRYEADYRIEGYWDDASNTPTSGFWYDSTFDHSCYAFEQCDQAGLPVAASVNIPREHLTLLDTYCGCGTVSVAANTVGITVVGGIDNNADAISSYTANTIRTEHGGFNPNSKLQPSAVHMPVQDAIADIRSGKLHLPSVAVLHASPPCQNVSSKKKKEARVITGAEAMAIVELAELLKPPYVTLEEVPGFVSQRFLKGNLKGCLTGWPDQPPPPAAAAAAGGPEADEVGSEEAEDADEDTFIVDDTGSAGQATSTAASAAASSDSLSDDEVVFSMLQLVVPKLLSLEYTVKVGFLLASDYGVPQARSRMFLMATRRGYRPAELPAPLCARPAGLCRQPLTTDPNFCLKNGVAAKWNDTLEVVPPIAEVTAQLSLHTTVAEAIGDLPPLLTATQTASRLGLEVAEYTPQMSVVFRCPLPVNGLEGGEPLPDNGLEGFEPVSRYSVYMRSPHTAHQASRLYNSFQPGVLRDHMVEHSSLAISKLLSTAKDKQGEREETKAEADARKRAGRRTDADGLAACVMGHNEPRKQCMHFLEDRMSSILERRRFQSMPDWLVVTGDHKARQQQVGNAVPYLLAVAVMGQVYVAATGEQPYKPPWPLHGPCLEGSGMPVANAAARASCPQQQYQQWVHQVDEVAEQQRVPNNGWVEVLLDCRKRLGRKASDIKDQQHQQYHELKQLAMEQGVCMSQQQHMSQPSLGKRVVAGSSRQEVKQEQQQEVKRVKM